MQKKIFKEFLWIQSAFAYFALLSPGGLRLPNPGGLGAVILDLSLTDSNGIAITQLEDPIKICFEDPTAKEREVKSPFALDSLPRLTLAFACFAIVISLLLVEVFEINHRIRVRRSNISFHQVTERSESRNGGRPRFFSF